nr:SwmB domain-containing protein [uncultured Undibacterium sp.]
MAITAAMRTQVTELYVSLFGRAPERDGLAFWVGKLDAGATYAQIAQQMFDVEPARAYYPASSTREELVAKFYSNVLGRTGDAEGVKFWTGKFDAAGKVTVGDVFAQIIAAVKGYTGTDAAALDSKALFMNKVAVGEYYGFTLNSNDIAGATAIMANVTKDPASVDVAKGGQGNNPVLTNGTDKVSGVNFISEQVYTPDGSKRINSLQDEDQLTGTQTGAAANNTLTATLGNANDNGGTVITPKLTNIQTVNVAFTGSSSTTVSNSAVTALDVQDATGMKAVNITRVASAAGTNNGRIENIKSVLDTMSIASTNANQAGTVEFSFGKDVLMGDNKGALNLSDVQIGTINIGENITTSGNGVANTSYEQLTISSTGQNNNVGTLNLPMDTGSAGSITINGDKALTLAQTTNVVNTAANGAQTIESVTFSGGLTGVNGRLATLTADGMTAGGVKLNLDAGFFTTGKADTSGVTQAVSVTGSKFDDTFYLGGKVEAADKLAGGLGNDTLVIYNAGTLIASAQTGNSSTTSSSAVTGVEALEVRLNAGGTSLVGMDKLADVKTILVRNEGAAVGAPAASTTYVGLYGMTADQANNVTVRHSNTGSNSITQNTLDLYSDSLAYTVTIAEGVNTDPRFNFILDTNDGTSVALKDSDTESNTVALVRPGNITSKITLSGGLAGTYLNLDTTTSGTASGTKAAVAATGSTPALPAIASIANAMGGLTNVSVNGSGSATSISGAQDLSLAVGQVKIVAATFDAKDELANVTARFSTNAASTVGAQTITMGAGSDTVIFDNITDSRAGLTGADLVDGGAGTDILAIDGDMAYNTSAGSVIALGASEWTGVKNFEQIKLISAGNTVANNGSTGTSGFAVANKTATTYELTLTDTLITNNSNGGTTVLAIVNNNNSGNVSNDSGATVVADNALSAMESSVTIDARSLSNSSRFSYSGEDGATRTNDRIIFTDVNFNGTHTLNGGAASLLNTNAADGNAASGSQAGNLDVLEFRNTVNASAADFNGVRNFGVIELTNDTSTTQVSTVELTDTIVGNLVSTSQSTLAETLSIRGFDSTTVALATTGLQLQAGSLGNLSNLNINLFNAGGINNIITGAGVDNVIMSRVNTSATNSTKDTLTLGAGNDTVTLLGNFNAGQFTAVADATGIITNVNALANGVAGLNATNMYGLDGVAGNADDAAAQLSYSDTINFGAGANTLYTYGAVNMTAATFSVDAGTGNSWSVVANSNISITRTQLASLISSGGTITFTGANNHTLIIVADASTATIDLSKIILTGTGTLSYATSGSTTTNSVIAPLGAVVQASNTAVPSQAVADVTAPTLNTATVNASTITLTYNEQLLGSSDPAGAAYTVNVTTNGVTTARTVTAADANGTTVTLTLATPVTANDTVAVTYVVPGTNAVKDVAGNSAAAIAVSPTVTNQTTGNTVTLTGPNAVVNGTTNTNASAVSTASTDTITTTYANIVGSTVDALAGTDTLTITDAVGAALSLAGITNVETINLAGGSTTFAVTGLTGATTTLSNTSATAGSTVTIPLVGQSFTSTGTGIDNVTLVTGAYTGTLSGGTGSDVLNIVTGTNLAGATVSGFETLVTAGSVSMTAAQYAAFTTVTDAAAAGQVTLTTAGTITTTALAANAGIETYVLNTGTNVVTLGGTADAARTITGNTGVDTVNTSVVNAARTVFTAAAGSDILSITGGVTVNTTIGTGAAGAGAMQVTGLETLNVSGTTTLGQVLTLVSTVDGDFATINASGVTGPFNLNVNGLSTAVGARTITLGDGVDTVTGILYKGGNTAATGFTLDFGKGNGSVADVDGVAATGTMDNGLFTIKATNDVTATTLIQFLATTANFLTGSQVNGTLLDFNAAITNIAAARKIGSVGPNAAGTLFIDTTNGGADTVMTLDVDGNGLFSAGDIQIYITGQAYTGGSATIVNGNVFL